MTHVTNPKPAKGSHKRQTAAKDRQQAIADSLVYAHVTERDSLCRACGEFPTSQRHHLRGREWTTREDVCGVCDRCHDWLHVRVGGKRLQMAGNAEERDETGRLCGLIVSWWVTGLGRWIPEPAGR